MPRRKNVDGDAATAAGGQPAKQPRVRKKREQQQPSSICSTPTGEHPLGGLKLEMGMGCHPQQGSMEGGPAAPPQGMHGMHHPHMGMPNGTMEDGPAGLAPPFGSGPPQGAPPDFFYQQGPPGTAGAPPSSHFGPPMFGGGPPPQMMLQQQPGTAAMGQQQPMGMGSGQFQEADQQHQMLPPMHHPHHPGLAQSAGAHQPPPHNSMAPAGPGPAPGHPQLPLPPHHPPPPMFPGGFPRQPPGPFLMFPPTIPQPPFLEFRIQEMNRRLYQFHSQFHQNSPENHEQWWEAFAQEFFDDGARISMSIPELLPEQGGHVKREFTVVRALIPRFYRSLFDHGVSQLYYTMHSPVQEMVDPHRYQNPELFGGCALNCENVLMETIHNKPMHTKVHTDCRLYIEFAPFHPTVGYRIRHWFLDIRGSQESYNICKDGSNAMELQQELARKGGLTTCGIPSQTIRELKMMQILQPMKPIMDRVKENNESPQLAMQSIIMERIEMERQRSAVAAHIQTPPHQQIGGVGPGSVASGSGGPGPGGAPPMAMMQGGMAPPQMGMAPPPPHQGQSGSAATPVEEPKPKPKRQRQRKTTANAGANAGGGGNNSPPKGKKGTMAAGQQTPPIGGPLGMGPMRGFMGAPGQFHPVGMPPPGQYHQDVLTVQEPSMMGCEYGEQDERQISRVENSAFAAAMSCGGGGQGAPMMPPPTGMVVVSTPGPSSMMPGQQQQQMVDNVQHMLGVGADFVDQHMQQQLQQHPHNQQQIIPPNSMWSLPPGTSGDSSGLGPPQAMSGGT